ncbi:MAG: CBS domain-containing protein, partial [Cyanobacteria bacterium P01_H01_bin.121]
MDLILCHTTADFDALGAAVGLSLLLPGSRIVLTGGAHPAVRDFLALHRDEYPLLERRAVNPQTITAIHIPDTQQRSRLGPAADWLDLPNLQTIAVYDHHATQNPITPEHGTGDLPATQQQIEAVGATTTLVAEQLQTAGIQPNPIEATVMALGIHVDTGSLTYEHSTVRDAQALTWLMQNRASQRAIATYTHPGFSAELQILLPTALQDLQTCNVHGQALAWVLLETTDFIPGLSSLASQLLEITESDALLLGAYLPVHDPGANKPVANNLVDPYRLTVIGRSQVDDTDLSLLFEAFGGGGHPRAAAMSTRTAEPRPMLEQLFEQLCQQVPAPLTARDLMSAPVRTIRPEVTITEAQRILFRYGHSGLSVVDCQAELVGIISRRDLDLALHHGFGHAPVKGYMTLNVRTITPATSLPEIERLMVTYDIGRLPVLENNNLVGIVTRTDVLRQVHQNYLQHQQRQRRRSSDQFNGQFGGQCWLPESVSDLLRSRLTPELWHLLQAIARAAEARGWHLYLVGGGVRDLLLTATESTTSSQTDQPDQVTSPHPLTLSDLDLVVDGFNQTLSQGAGVELAHVIQAQYPNARLEVHGRFQTAALL